MDRTTAIDAHDDATPAMTALSPTSVRHAPCTGGTVLTEEAKEKLVAWAAPPEGAGPSAAVAAAAAADGPPDWASEKVLRAFVGRLAPSVVLASTACLLLFQEGEAAGSEKCAEGVRRQAGEEAINLQERKK